MRLFILSIAAVLLFAGIVKADVSRKIDINVNLASLQDRNQSYIIIDSLPSYDVAVTQKISFPMMIYRGSTLKRTVYVWIESNGKRISTKAKFSLPNRFSSYNLTAELNITSCSAAASQLIVAEGLGLNTTKQVILESGCTAEESLQKQGEISFSVIDFPSTIGSGNAFTTRILVSNPTENNLELSAWSYVYRSSKSYSGGREQNMKVINIPEYSNVTFDLENIINASAGDYSLKIKLLRSDRKSPEEITLPIAVVGNASENQEKNTAKLSIAENPGLKNATINTTKKSLLDLPSLNRTGIVYESSSAKARNLTVYFLIAALAILLVILILKKL